MKRRQMARSGQSKKLLAMQSLGVQYRLLLESEIASLKFFRFYGSLISFRLGAFVPSPSPSPSPV